MEFKKPICKSEKITRIAKTTKTKSTDGRYIKLSEVKKIGKSYYDLRRTLYDLSIENELNVTAKKEVNKFLNDITKSLNNFSIARATNFTVASF